MQKIISIVATLIVAISFVFVFFVKSFQADTETSPENLEGRLKHAIPVAVGNWTSTDHQLGDTEEVQRAAEKVLNLSDYVNRSYKNGDTEFTVYIAYWKPDTMEIHRASSHSPDRCWVANGWKNIAEKKTKFDSLDIDGEKLFGGYSRAYKISTDRGDVERFVWYWHIVDGKPYGYGKMDNFTPTISNWLKGVFSRVLEGMPEQYFIRIDSSTPLETLKTDEGFKTVMKSVGKLILDEKTPAKK